MMRCCASVLLLFASLLSFFLMCPQTSLAINANTNDNGAGHHGRPRPEIPQSFNTTIKGHLVSLCPFTATFYEDRAQGLSRIDFLAKRPSMTVPGSIIFDVNSKQATMFSTIFKICHQFKLKDAVVGLLSWNYFLRSRECGYNCWEYTEDQVANFKFTWLFRDSKIFSFEANPIYKGKSNFITVCHDTQVGPQGDDTFAIPAFCSGDAITDDLASDAKESVLAYADLFQHISTLLADN